MVCMTSCVIAGAFLFASIFVCYHASPSWSHVSNWSSRENKQRYFLIVNERRSIYIKGFLLGLVLSLATAISLKNSQSISKLCNICIIFAMSATIQYFFYVLSPKSDYMILHLDNKQEREAWLKIYKSMQINYHAGFLLGLIAMMFMGNAIY